MIELQIEPYCENCNNFIPEVHTHEWSNFFENEKQLKIDISCESRERCYRNRVKPNSRPESTGEVRGNRTENENIREEKILRLLNRCCGEFSMLSSQNTEDKKEFDSAISKCRQIMAARIVRKYRPELFKK